MIYYIMKGHIFTIFLSLSHLSSVNFSTQVTDYVGGELGDFKVYELNHHKSLIFEPKKKDFQKNFITFTKKDKYHFNLVYDEKFSNKDIEIREAEKCSYFNLVVETKDYQLFECPKSLFFVNKRKTPVKVNDLVISEKSYLSKGPPIYLEGSLIYYQGRKL